MFTKNFLKQDNYVHTIEKQEKIINKQQDEINELLAEIKKLKLSSEKKSTI